MVNTSTRPITVDGVRLDTLAWNISKITRQVAGRRAADYEVPGLDGVVASLNDPLDPITFGLEVFVMGTDADGAVPPAGRADTFRANLDELVHLFGKRHALLDLRETVATGTERQAMAKVVDAISPDVNLPGSAGSFTVGLVIPSGMWQDAATQDWVSAAPVSGVAQEVTTLQGSTERVTDAVVLVQGPVTNPRLSDPVTGAYVQLNRALSGTEFWRVNVATWASRYGTGLGLGSADTTGTDAQPLTQYGGTRNQVHFLPLVPARDAGARRVKVALTGTGMTAATRVSIRGRRKYAA